MLNPIITTALAEAVATTAQTARETPDDSRAQRQARGARLLLVRHIQATGERAIA